MLKIYFKFIFIGVTVALIVTGYSFRKSQTLTNNISLIRGPYLQSLTPNSVVIKWETSSRTKGIVRYGPSPVLLEQESIEKNKTRNHSVIIKNLTPGTKYYYGIGDENIKFQPDSLNYFVTFPSADSKELSTIWVIGDAGSGKKEQNLVRDSYLSYCSNKKPDLWIWLGDNAYEKGKKEEYQQNVFTSHFEDIMKNTPVYSCIGNHDMANMGYQNFFTRIFNFHYFTVFDHPEKGEAGGVPSNSRHYYSFDYRNIHFISLDSYGSFNHSSSSMYKWLQEDLKQNNQTWTIVFFHHPPYTKGTHDSDYEQEMLDMRENILPLLEQYGVDLVLSGHSHVYERSFLINGHYGRSESFNSSMMLDKGKGSPEAPYRKEWRGKGTVYAVVGNSGKAGGRKEGWPHPAMAYYNSEAMGSMKLEVKGDSLHARFVDTEKKVRDEFVMTKRVSSIKYQNAGI